MDMVVIGVDSHKRSHTAVAVDGTGRKLAERTAATSPAGHLELVRWASRWAARQWALEDCRNLSRRLSDDLVCAGEGVVRVPPGLMAGARRANRERGKSDPIDALAVARAALREDLPVATLDGPEREVRLLVDHRDGLVAERTRAENRLRWHLHELAIAEPPPRSLGRTVVRARLERELDGRSGMVARLARELVGRIGDLSRTIGDLAREIERHVGALAPTLRAMPGCGGLTTGKLVGEVAGAGRFRSRAAFARHNGSAPIPVWSGSERHRLNRGGNRQLNAALHRIAITQLRLGGAGKAYVEQRLARGDTKTEAIRALRRRISDEVFRRLRQDEADRAATGGIATAA